MISGTRQRRTERPVNSNAANTTHGCERTRARRHRTLPYVEAHACLGQHQTTDIHY